MKPSPEPPVPGPPRVRRSLRWRSPWFWALGLWAVGLLALALWMLLRPEPPPLPLYRLP